MKNVHSVLLMSAVGLTLVLGACANDSTGPMGDDQKPFMQTEPGTLPITGQEPALPNNPGYNRTAPASPINPAPVEGGVNSPGYRPGAY